MKKILLIEDNRQQAELISRYLKNNNYCVINAYDGKEAIKIITMNVFDFIIVDYVIPHINGLDVVKFVKLNRKTAHIPILMISANDINVKCNFLKKPFKFSDLRQILETNFISL